MWYSVSIMNSASADIPKHAGGRPTKLTDVVRQLARSYVDECKDTVEHFESDNGKHWETIRVKLPTMEGLARKLKIRRETVWAWSKEDEEFSNIVDDLMAEQADRLLQRGLSGEYNPTIAKLMLSGKHGYVEKTETDVTSKGEALAPQQLDPVTAAAFAKLMTDQTKSE